MKTTKVFAQNLAAYNTNCRTIVNKGSARSSKTWSVLQLLYLIASVSDSALTISVVSESMPHLKRGCLRDFETLLRGESLWNEQSYNRTDKVYRIGESIIEFFSADNAAKVHGPARDILFINEAINIPYETYRQLAIRTRQYVFIDYNPCYHFWIDEHVLNRHDTQLIQSTYLDNNFLSAAQVAEIESNKHDKAWWTVYGLGQTGTREGFIYTNWHTVDNLPLLYKNRWIGLDFGFANDPTAIVDVRMSEGELWIDELAYDRGMDNLDIARLLLDNELHKYPIVADSAEPKSIAEIRRHNLRIEPAEKGQDSVAQGIAVLQRYTIRVTKRSTNLIHELRNYKWKTDLNGDNLNIPVDRFNHALDALRYVALNKLSSHKLYGKGARIRVLR